MQKTTINITKAERARLAPTNEKVCTGRDMAGVLAKVELSEEEAAAWHRDLQSTRKTLKAPNGKWCK